MRIFQHHRWFCLLSLLSLVHCGVFTSSSTNSTGEQSLESDPSLTTFDASANLEALKSVPVKNATKNDLILYKIGFANNVCGALSYYGLVDAQGKLLQDSTIPLNYKIPAGGRVYIGIRFNPEACEFKDYETTLYTYFKDAKNETHWSSFIFKVIGEAPQDTGTTDTCDPSFDYASEAQEYKAFGIPPAGTYLLRVDRMRAFIFPVSAPKEYLSIIGTDVGAVDPDDFINPYLKVIVGEQTGNKAPITLKKITSCDEFMIPSAPTDTFFLGSPIELFSKADYEGEIILEDNPKTKTRQVHVGINDIRVQLLSEDIGSLTPQNDDSLIDDPQTKSFRVTLQVDFTTRQTDPYTYLVDQLILAKGYTEKITLPNGTQEDMLSLTPTQNAKRSMAGKALNNAQILLVGVGIFDNKDEDFIGSSDTAKPNLLDSPAYLFTQINATLLCEGDCNAAQ